MLKIGFVGAKGTNLLANSNGTGGGSTVATSGIIPGTANLDQLPDQYLSMGSALLTKVVNPYYNHGGAGVIGSATIAANQLLRPYPEFSSVNAFAGGAQSLYNALNVKLTKSFSMGFLCSRPIHGQAPGIRSGDLATPSALAHHPPKMPITRKLSIRARFSMFQTGSLLEPPQSCRSGAGKLCSMEIAACSIAPLEAGVSMRSAWPRTANP